MKSLLLNSILIVTLGVPTLLARDPNPRRAVKRMLALMLVFNAAYLAYITLVHPVAFVPEWSP